MPVSIGSVVLLLCLLQIKHMFADYFLQTPKMLSGRCSYWHMGRAQHAGVHVIGSAIVFLIVGMPLPALLAVLIAEWIIHFHIDYWKASYSERNQLQPNQAVFWRAAGLDQCMHQLTYAAMIWAWLEVVG